MAKFLCGGSPQDYTMFANVEDGATSSQAYVKGEYIVRNKVMREVIAPIAQGDSFVIGTNLSSTGTNVGEELTELNSSLTASDNLKFRFATDGAGNYGYLKADDSFVPFSGGVKGFAILGYSSGVSKFLDSDGTYHSEVGIGGNVQSNIDVVNSWDLAKNARQVGTVNGTMYFTTTKAGYYSIDSFGGQRYFQYCNADTELTLTLIIASGATCVVMYYGDTNPFE